MEADIVELRQRGIKFTQGALRAATPPHGLRIGGPLPVRPVRNAPKLPLGLAGCGRRLPIGGRMHYAFVDDSASLLGLGSSLDLCAWRFCGHFNRAPRRRVILVAHSDFL
jgi:hypothetical protein